MEPLTVKRNICYALYSEVMIIDMEKKRMDLPLTFAGVEKVLTDGHSYKFRDAEGMWWKIEYEGIYYITALIDREVQLQFSSLERAMIEMLYMVGLFIPKGYISEQEQA